MTKASIIAPRPPMPANTHTHTKEDPKKHTNPMKTATHLSHIPICMSLINTKTETGEKGREKTSHDHQTTAHQN